ncbi:NADP-dependent oxidoreductase domain-containing protein [Flammula alnicola]|nr:NADP-dependent oxidoreductase domain-containing protein [Flammula alnicola]
MPWDPVKLSDGNAMPSIAYGTLLKQAFSVGIMHVDTAQNYTNEPEAGIAIHECGIPREKIFVTTKCLKNLGLSYIDLYLIHGPELCDDIQKCWKEMEKLKESGLAKSIGVSNFEVEHLEQVSAAAKYIPVVNQILFHPYVYLEQLPILKLCAKKNIVVEAYSPLIPVTKRPGGPLDAPVGAIAKNLGASMDQVLLAWAKAKGSVPVTMSLKKERLKGYIKAGDLKLSDDDINAIDEAGVKGAGEA